jgi:site-specific DNA recombinase
LHAKRAAIYCRISEDRESLESGVSRQEDDCRLAAAALGYQVVEVFIDNDISASTKSKKRRENYERMLAAAGNREFEAIISYSNSRLTRRPMELEALIVLHEKTGIVIQTVKSGTDDLSTADGRMVARIKAAVDAGEAERTGERVTRAALERRRDGKPHGGPKMFGYIHPTPENGLHYLEQTDEPAADAIRAGAVIMLNGGRVSRVVDLWNELGLKTPGGKPWGNPSNVQRLLTSPRIAGYTSHDDKLLVRGDWPAIIDRETHEALVEACAPRKAHAPKTRKYLLPGYIFCECGSPMVANVSPAHRLDRYLCRTQRGGCGKVSRSRPWVDARVRAFVQGWLEQEHQPVAIDGTGAEAAEARAVELDAEIGRLRDAMQQGVFTVDEVAPKVAEAREELTRVRAEQAEAARAAAQPLDNAESVALWAGDDLETLEQRRAILARAVKMVVVKPLGAGQAWGAGQPVPEDSIAIIPA